MSRSFNRSIYIMLSFLLIFSVFVLPQGQASAEDSGTPAVPEMVNAGVNIAPTSDMFVDVMKLASPFWGMPVGSPAPAKDVNGWPLGDARVMFFDERPVAVWGGNPADDPDVEDHIPDVSGTYQLSFKGQADIVKVQGNWTVQNKQYDEETNTTTAELVMPAYTTGNWDDLIMITGFTNTVITPGAGTNTGISDVKLIRPGYPANTDKVFTDEFLSALQPFSTIRFMDMNLAQGFVHYCKDGDSTTTCERDTFDWANRKKPSDATQNQNANHYDSIAWEYVALLGNLTGKDIWINIPIQATQDYMVHLAALLKNSVDPGINIYVEYANEVWGGIPAQKKYNKDAACVEVTGKTCAANASANNPNTNLNSGGATSQDIWNERLYARTIKEVSDIFKAEFGPESIGTIIRPVITWQHVAPTDINRILSWLQSQYGAPSEYLYAVATAPYIACRETNPRPSDEAGYIACFESQFDTKYLFSSAVQTKAVADTFGLEYVAYEGGTDTSLAGEINVGVRIKTERYVNTDPDESDIKDVIKNFLNRWAGMGGGVFNYYKLNAKPSRYGSWGLLEDFSKLDSPKYQAIVELANSLAEPPGNLTAELTGGSVKLNWNASDSEDVTYTVMRATSEEGPFKAIARELSATSYTDLAPNLESNTTYYYKSVAVNFASTADSNVAMIDTGENVSNDLIAYEPFDYAAGTIMKNLDGGFGWKGGWELQAATPLPEGYRVGDSSPLTYLSLNTSPTYMIGGQSGSYSKRYVDLSPTGAFKDYLTSDGKNVGKPGTTLWTSFLIRKDKDVADKVKFNFIQNVALGFGDLQAKTDNVKVWAFEIDGQTIKTDVPIVIGESVLVVIKIEYGNGSPNHVSAYVNPTSLGGDEPDSPDVSVEKASKSSFDSLMFVLSQATNSVNTASVSDVRIGKTYASVTPVTESNEPPVFTEQPQSATVAPGSSVTLEAQAAGAPTVEYQWFKDNVAISGANGNQYTIDSFGAAHAGSYTVQATNPFGSVLSDPAVLVLGSAAASGAYLGIDPELEIGEDFDVTVGVNQIETEFNALELTIQYDPSKLAFSTESFGSEDHPDALTLTDDAISVAPGNPDLQLLGTVVTPDGKIHLAAVKTGEPVSSAGNTELFVLHGAVHSDIAAGATSVSVSDAKVSENGDDYAINGNSYPIALTKMTVDKTELNAAIQSASSTLNAAIVGTEPGQYPLAAKTALQTAISQAQTVFDDPLANQAQVSQAIADLQQAANTFNASVIVAGLNKTALTDLLAKAQSKHDSAEEGTKLTQYAVGSKADLLSAIQAAASALGSATAQQQLDDAANTLSAALQAFSNQVVTLISGETQITIKDLSLIAKYFNKSRDDANWDQYDKANIYGDGITIQVLAKVARLILEDWYSQQ